MFAEDTDDGGSGGDLQLLLDALLSRPCLWQLFLTLTICSSVHTLMSWGSVSNWAAHEPIGVCVFAWSHPTGYSGMGTSLMEVMPIDALVTAFFACLGAMPRMFEVQRGWVLPVPPTAMCRGPLWLLFPRGVSLLPRLSSLLAVTVVWGALWGGVCLGALSIAWLAGGGALSGRSCCVSPWTYTIARACWSTSEGVLVSAGSFLMWASKGLDPTTKSVAERAMLLQEAEDEAARKAAASFGVFQCISAVLALTLIVRAHSHPHPHPPTLHTLRRWRRRRASYHRMRHP